MIKDSGSPKRYFLTHQKMMEDLGIIKKYFQNCFKKSNTKDSVNTQKLKGGKTNV